MTNAEMNRRLATIPADVQARVEQMIHDGYGGHGITLEAPVTLKQANAMFQKVQGQNARRANLDSYHDDGGDRRASWGAQS